MARQRRKPAAVKPAGSTITRPAQIQPAATRRWGRRLGLSSLFTERGRHRLYTSLFTGLLVIVALSMVLPFCRLPSTPGAVLFLSVSVHNPDR